MPSSPMPSRPRWGDHGAASVDPIMTPDQLGPTYQIMMVADGQRYALRCIKLPLDSVRDLHRMTHEYQLVWTTREDREGTVVMIPLLKLQFALWQRIVDPEELWCCEPDHLLASWLTEHLIDGVVPGNLPVSVEMAEQQANQWREMILHLAHVHNVGAQSSR